MLSISIPPSGSVRLASNPAYIYSYAGLHCLIIIKLKKKQRLCKILCHSKTKPYSIHWLTILNVNKQSDNNLLEIDLICGIVKNISKKKFVKFHLPLGFNKILPKMAD